MDDHEYPIDIDLHNIEVEQYDALYDWDYGCHPPVGWVLTIDRKLVWIN